MARAYSTAAIALAAASLLIGCGGGDDADEAIRDAVLTCLTTGGATIGDDADVAIAGGSAVAVVGVVDAGDALISRCLDDANR